MIFCFVTARSSAKFTDISEDEAEGYIIAQ
jgi:hypothetical protein